MSLVTRNYPMSTNEQYNVYYIAMDRGYPYFDGMTLADLKVFETSTLDDLMLVSGRFGDERVIYYWRSDNR